MADSTFRPVPEEPVRERLLRIALGRFRREGYEAAAVSRITREAGVAKGTFFNHFPTKGHLLSEAFRRMVGEVVEEIAAGRTPSGTGAILAFATALLDRMEADPPLAAALGPRLGSLPPPGEEAPRPLEGIREWMEARLHETLPVAVPFREVDLPSLSRLLAWTLRGHLEGPVDDVRARRVRLREQLRFLLESAGLPAAPPEA